MRRLILGWQPDSAQSSNTGRGLLALLCGINLLGALALDAYLPAFDAIAQALSASPVQMQQTLSAYFLGFGIANLLVGPTADCIGRRPVVLSGILLNFLAFMGCAWVQTPAQLIGLRFMQGMACSAAVCVTLAIVRDIHDTQQAQQAFTRLVGLLTLGPILAPVLGGWLLVWVGWRGLFGTFAAASLLLLVITGLRLPETLPRSARTTLRPKDVALAYRNALLNRRFVMLSLTFSTGFGGIFLYVLAAPAYLGTHLGLAPTQYFMAFGFVLGMTGLIYSLCFRWLRHAPLQRVMRWGFAAMVASCIANLSANLTWTAHISWSLWPIVGYALGFALIASPLQVLALDVHPKQRGLASALLATGVALTHTVVAGLLAPQVIHSTVALACASAMLLAMSLAAWNFTPAMPPERLS